MSTLTYFDTDVRDVPELALHADHVAAGDWNGFAVPVATAAEFRRLMAAWAANDPHGLWAGFVVEADGALIFTDADGSRDIWTVVGRDSAGAALYALSGWMWTL